MGIGTDTITVAAGEDLVLDFEMNDGTNISGWAIEFNVRGGSGVVVTKNASITNGAAGTYGVSLVSADTVGLAPGSYVYDCWRVDPSLARRLAQGNFIVEVGAIEHT